MSPLYKLLAPVILILLVAMAVFYFDNGKLLPANTNESQAGMDDDDDDVAAGDLLSGRAVVHMPENIQAEANLQLLKLARAERRGEIHAYARVLDIQSLVELGARYRESVTEKRMAENVTAISGQELERLQMLRKEASNVSEREVQQSRLQWLSNQSLMQTAEVKLENIRNQMLQGWGTVLTEEILNNTALADDLMQRRSLLLLVTLEGKQQLPDDTGKILVNVQGSREQAQTAQYISPAAFADNQIYGQTHFFHTPADGLRQGLFLDAWIPEGDDSREGVYIPPVAVIWYADKPWVYIKTGADTFSRRELKDYTVTRDGWFVKEGFLPGEDIVLHGGQMLLSQEFRWSIPDEDNDP